MPRMAKNVASPQPAWKGIAVNLQQNLLYRFGANDWDLYKQCKSDYLAKTVGYALFGPPRNLPSAETANISGYEPKEIEAIHNVCTAIRREDVHGEDSSGDTWMSMVFVCTEIAVGKEDELLIATVPVFRVPKLIVGQCDSVRFIDSNARVYVDWDDYLRSNQLPKCNICYPRYGVYKSDANGNVIVEFGQTPALGRTQRFLSVLDKTSSVIAIGTSVISVASLLFPVTENLLNMTAWSSGLIGVYGAIRSSGTLIDRMRHKQSVGLGNSESRSCWLSLGGSVMGTLSTNAMNSLQKIAKTRKEINKLNKITVTTLSSCSMAISGLGVVNNGFAIHEKYKEKSLTPFDVYQFATSAVFFAHSAINMKTAGSIIAEVQKEAMQMNIKTTGEMHNDDVHVYKNKSKYHKYHKKCNKFKGWQCGNSDQKKYFMKKFKMCNRKEEFLNKFSHETVEIWRTEKNVHVTESGHLEINHKLVIDPAKFFEISKAQRRVFIEASKSLAEGNLSHGQFREIMKSVNLGENIPLKNQDFQNSLSHSWRSKEIKDLKRQNEHHLMGDNMGLEQNTKDLSRMKGIRSENDYFSRILEANKEFFETQSNVNFSESGHVEINQKLTIDPMEYFKISHAKRKLFLKASNELAEGRMSHKHFKNIMKSLHHEGHSSRRHHQIENTPEEAKSSSVKSPQESSSRQRSMLAIVTFYGPANIYMIMKNFDKSLHQRLFEVAVKVSELVECSPARTFFDILGTVCNYVQNIAAQMENKYQEDLETAKAQSGEDFDQELFDKSYKINGKRFSHFCSIVLESLTSDSDVIERIVNNVEEGMELYDDWRDSNAEESAGNNLPELEYDGPGSDEEPVNCLSELSNERTLQYQLRRRHLPDAIGYQSSVIGETSRNIIRRVT